MIEIIDLEDNEDISKIDTPKWREQQNLAIKYYKEKQKVNEELLRAYLD